MQTLTSINEVTTTASTAKRKEKKEQLTKAQKRRLISKTGACLSTVKYCVDLKSVSVDVSKELFWYIHNDTPGAVSDVIVML